MSPLPRFLLISCVSILFLFIHLCAPGHEIRFGGLGLCLPIHPTQTNGELFALLLTQQFCAAKLQKIPHVQIYAEISTKNALFCVKV